MPRTPPPVERPAFALWIWERKLELREVSDAVGCSYEQVRLITLPFEDSRRRVPAADLMERIHVYTDGAVDVASWYPKHLREGRLPPPQVVTP